MTISILAGLILACMVVGLLVGIISSQMDQIEELVRQKRELVLRLELTVDALRKSNDCLERIIESDWGDAADELAHAANQAVLNLEKQA